jgi:hypothetical protein
MVAAEPVADQHGRALESGQDRVAVAAPGHQAGVADLAADLDQGREGLHWSTWKAADGSTRRSCEVRVGTLQVLDQRPEASEQSEEEGQ